MNTTFFKPALGSGSPSLVTSIFIWLGGASPKAAMALPPSQHRILVAMGVAVLVPAALGFASAAYTVSLMTDSLALVLAGGLGWAAAVIALDQLILAALAKKGVRRTVQGLVRLVMAGVVGLAVSHPLTLRLFHDRLSMHIEQQRRDEVARLSAQSLDEIASLQATADVEAPPLSATTAMPAPTSTASLPATISHSFRALRESIQAEDDRTVRLRNDLSVLDGLLQEARKKRQDEIDGKLGGRRPSEGSEAARILKEEVQPLEARVKSMLTTMDASTQRATTLRAQLAEQEHEETVRHAAVLSRAAELELAAQEQAQKLHAEIAAASIHKAQAAEQRKQEMQRRHDAEITRVQAEPRNDVFARTEALHALAAQHPFVWWQYGMIMLAFLALDTLPVVVKLFSDGTHYDHLRSREDWIVAEDLKAFQLVYPHYAQAKADAEIRSAAAHAEIAGFVQTFQAKLETITALSQQVELANRNLMAMLATSYETSSKLADDHLREASDQTLEHLRNACLAALQNLAAQLAQPTKSPA